MSPKNNVNKQANEFAYKMWNHLTGGDPYLWPTLPMLLIAGFCCAPGWSGGLLLLAALVGYQVHRQLNKKKSPLSPLTLIQLAHGSYLSLSEPLPIRGWKRVDRHSSPFSTHHGNVRDDTQVPCVDVFHNKHQKTLVLSVRGTDPSLIGDLRQDMELFRDRVQTFVEGEDRHELPQYAVTLLKIMTASQEQYPDCQLYLTGHSLGAACCEAAWLADLALKTKLAEATAAAGGDSEHDGGNTNSSIDDDCLWKCVTWESPGFAVPPELRDVLDQNRDILDTHVVHYLGAPNVINCLHPHISSNRRYRIFLEHDNRLTCWHVLGCLWRDAVVMMNWICVARGAFNLGAKFSLQAAHSAEEASALAKEALPGSYWQIFLNNTWRKVFVSPTCPDAGANFRAVADVLSKYDTELGNVQEKLACWGFQYIMPIGDNLTWSVVRGNALLRGAEAVEYLLRQHSLLNHIDSFHVRSGYPLRWVQMEEWPTLSEMTTRTIWEGLRSSLVPHTPSEHFNPAVEIENRIGRLGGYREGRRFTATHQVLRRTYNYLGDGFFDEIMGIRFSLTRPLNELEERCREEYRRCGQRLPAPVYIVG